MIGTVLFILLIVQLFVRPQCITMSSLFHYSPFIGVLFLCNNFYLVIHFFLQNDFPVFHSPDKHLTICSDKNHRAYFTNWQYRHIFSEDTVS